MCVSFFFCASSLASNFRLKLTSGVFLVLPGCDQIVDLSPFVIDGVSSVLESIETCVGIIGVFFKRI